MSRIDRVVLIGFSGGGKTTVARALADRLAWSAIDVDDLIVAEYGESIPAIFANHGEQRFRDSERRLLSTALMNDRVVIATGGGAVVDAKAWSNDLLRRPGTFVVALDISPEVVLQRLQAHQASEGDAVERPMISGDDPLGRIRALKLSRQGAYDRADLTLVVDHISADAVVDELASIVAPADQSPAVALQTPSGKSEIFIAPGARGQIGAHLQRRWPNANRIWLITEENVGRHHMADSLESIRAAGYRADGLAIAPGESSKSLAGAGILYDWLLG